MSAGRNRRPLQNKLIAFGGTLLFLAFAVWFANYIFLGAALNKATLSDKRNGGIVASAHFQYYVNPSIMVFNIKRISGQNSRIDVFRLFEQFAQLEQNRHFSAVQLACEGKPRFVIDGDYFNQLGREYSTQNPIYTLRTVTDHAHPVGFNPKFAPSDDSIMGAMSGIQNFSKFIDSWCFRAFSG